MEAAAAVLLRAQKFATALRNAADAFEQVIANIDSLSDAYHRIEKAWKSLGLLKEALFTVKTSSVRVYSFLFEIVREFRSDLIPDYEISGDLGLRSLSIIIIRWEEENRMGISLKETLLDRESDYVFIYTVLDAIAESLTQLNEILKRARSSLVGLHSSQFIT